MKILQLHLLKKSTSTNNVKISAITKKSSECMIVIGKITEMSKIEDYSTKTKNGKRLNFTLADESATIKCVVFNEGIKDIMPIINLNEVFKFENVTVIDLKKAMYPGEMTFKSTRPPLNSQTK